MASNPQQGRTLREQLELTQWLMQFPAMTVMVFLRKDLGYRFLNPFGLLAVTCLVLPLAAFAKPYDEPGGPGLLLFAVAALFLAIGQREKRWKEFKRGIRQHSYYIGTSRFEGVRWLPRFCRRDRKISRILDPIVCVLAGLGVFRHARPGRVADLFRALSPARLNSPSTKGTEPRPRPG